MSVARVRRRACLLAEVGRVAGVALGKVGRSDPLAHVERRDGLLRSGDQVLLLLLVRVVVLVARAAGVHLRHRSGRSLVPNGAKDICAEPCTAARQSPRAGRSAP